MAEVPFSEGGPLVFTQSAVLMLQIAYTFKPILGVRKKVLLAHKELLTADGEETATVRRDREERLERAGECLKCQMSVFPGGVFKAHEKCCFTTVNRLCL